MQVEIAKCVVLAASWYAALDKLKEARADAQTYSKAREAESRRIQPLLDLQRFVKPLSRTDSSHQSNILQKAQQQVKRQSRALAEHSQIMDSAQKAADRAVCLASSINCTSLMLDRKENARGPRRISELSVSGSRSANRPSVDVKTTSRRRRRSWNDLRQTRKTCRIG